MQQDGLADHRDNIQPRHGQQPDATQILPSQPRPGLEKMLEVKPQQRRQSKS